MTGHGRHAVAENVTCMVTRLMDEKTCAMRCLTTLDLALVQDQHAVAGMWCFFPTNNLDRRMDGFPLLRDSCQFIEALFAAFE